MKKDRIMKHNIFNEAIFFHPFSKFALCTPVEYVRRFARKLSHPCMEGYSRLYIDKNHYFYPVSGMQYTIIFVMNRELLIR